MLAMKHDFLITSVKMLQTAQNFTGLVTMQPSTLGTKNGKVLGVKVAIVFILAAFTSSTNNFTAYTATRSPQPEVPGVGDWLQ